MRASIIALLRIEQAGGIVFRHGGGGVEILLVRAKRDPTLWIFPKGRIEPGESAADAALRETEEEAAITGDVLGPVGEPLEFESGRGPIRVQYFLIKALRDIEPTENRERRWFPIDDVAGNLVYDSARQLLDEARAALRA